MLSCSSPVKGLCCPVDQVLAGQLCSLMSLAWPLNKRLRSCDAPPSFPPTDGLLKGLPALECLQAAQR